MAQVTRRTIRSPWSTGISEWRHQANIAAHNVTRQLPTAAQHKCCAQALSQKRTFECVCAMSALPPKADIAECDWNVCFVPKADILRCSKESLSDHLISD